MKFDKVLEYLTKLEEISNSNDVNSIEAEGLLLKRMSEFHMNLIIKFVESNY